MERARSLISTFLFKNIPGLIIIEPIRLVRIWTNQEPLDNGVPDVYCPRNIIMGKDLACDKHCKFILGSYVEAHKYRKITNNMMEQTVSGICVGPTTNFQEICKIFSLNTGRVVTRKQKMRETPMPTWVIQHVEALAMRDGQYLANSDEQLFTDLTMIMLLLPPSMRVDLQE